MQSSKRSSGPAAPVLVLAHRGYHATVPENTLAAFAEAAALEVDGIETDVRLSRDGVAVLFHDRMTPDGRAVAALTRAEISAAAGYEVPTLADAVERHDLLWNVEVKSTDALVATQDVLRAFARRRRFLVTSFLSEVVARLDAAIDADRGLILGHRREALQGLSPKGRLATIVWDFEHVDRSIVTKARAAGFRNFVYGMTSPDEHRHCVALGFDAIISDHPDLARAAVSRGR